ncbi:MAG TPA: DUF559 domain-containing protein [Pseudolysinimonas sp.]|nr:DUF559 domain-containing protein [Pseudolysinimonas sp.]
MHVTVAPHSARLRSPLDRRIRLDRRLHPLTVHWSSPAHRTLEPIPETIARTYRCQGPEVAFILLESALHRRLIGRGEIALVNALAPADFRPLVRLASPQSESGTESMMKLVLRRLGVSFDQQVEFDGVGRVDFGVGRSLVIEVDSKEHHSDPTRDRWRDAMLSARGYRVLRFMYSQIVGDRGLVEASVLGAVVRGDVA